MTHDSPSAVCGRGAATKGQLRGDCRSNSPSALPVALLNWANNSPSCYTLLLVGDTAVATAVDAYEAARRTPSKKKNYSVEDMARMCGGAGARRSWPLCGPGHLYMHGLCGRHGRRRC